MARYARAGCVSCVTCPQRISACAYTWSHPTPDNRRGAPPVAAECVCAHVFICMRAMPASNDGCYARISTSFRSEFRAKIVCNAAELVNNSRALAISGGSRIIATAKPISTTRYVCRRPAMSYNHTICTAENRMQHSSVYVFVSHLHVYSPCNSP